jgi:hypothetical protein
VPAVDTEAVMAALESSLPLTRVDERQVNVIQSPSNAKRNAPKRKKARNQKKAPKSLKLPSAPSEKFGRSQLVAFSSEKQALNADGFDRGSVEGLNASLPKEIALSSDDPVSDLDQSIRHFPMKQIFAGGSVDVSGLGHSRDDLSDSTNREEELDKYAPLISSNKLEIDADMKRESRALADSLSGTEKPGQELQDDWAEEKADKHSEPPVETSAFPGGCIPASLGHFDFTFPWQQQPLLKGEEQEIMKRQETMQSAEEADIRMRLEPKEGYKRMMHESGFNVANDSFPTNPNYPQTQPSQDSRSECRDLGGSIEVESDQDLIAPKKGEDPLGVEPVSSLEWKKRRDPPTREKFIVYETAADSSTKKPLELVSSSSYDVRSSSQAEVNCDDDIPNVKAQVSERQSLEIQQAASKIAADKELSKPEPLEQRKEPDRFETFDIDAAEKKPFSLSALKLDDDSVSREQQGLPALLSTIHEEDSEGIAETVTGSIGRLSLAPEEDNPVAGDGTHDFVNRILQFGQDALGLSPKSKEELDSRMKNLSPTSKRVLETSIKQARVESIALPRNEKFNVIDLTGVSEDDLFKKNEEDDGVWIFDLTKLSDEEDSFRDLDDLLGFAAARLGLARDAPQESSESRDLGVVKDLSNGELETVIIVEGTQERPLVRVKGPATKAFESGNDRYSVNDDAVKSLNMRDRYAVEVDASSQQNNLDDTDSDSESFLSKVAATAERERYKAEESIDTSSPTSLTGKTEDILCGSEEFEVVHRGNMAALEDRELEPDAEDRELKPDTAVDVPEPTSKETLTCPPPPLALGIETGNESRVMDDYASRMSSLTRVSTKTSDHGPLAPKIDVTGNRVFNFVFTGDEDTHHEDEVQQGGNVQAFRKRGVRPEDMRNVRSVSNHLRREFSTRPTMEKRTTLNEREEEQDEIPRTLNFETRGADHSDSESPKSCGHSPGTELSASARRKEDDFVVAVGHPAVGAEIVNAQSGIEFFDFLCEGPLVACGGDEEAPAVRQPEIPIQRASHGETVGKEFEATDGLVQKNGDDFSRSVSFEVDVPQAIKKQSKMLSSQARSKQSSRIGLHDQVEILLEPLGETESRAGVKQVSSRSSLKQDQDTQSAMNQEPVSPKMNSLKSKSLDLVIEPPEDQDFLDSFFGGAESFFCPSPHGTDVAEIGETTLGHNDELSVSSSDKCERETAERALSVKRRFEAPRPEERMCGRASIGPACPSGITEPVCNRKQGPKPEGSGAIQKRNPKPNPECIATAQRQSSESQKKEYVHRKGPTPEENPTPEVFGRIADGERGSRGGPVPEQNRVVISGVLVVKGADVACAHPIGAHIEGRNVDFGGELLRRESPSLGSFDSSTGERFGLIPGYPCVAGVDVNPVTAYASTRLEKVPGIYVVPGVDLQGDNTSAFVRVVENRFIVDSLPPTMSRDSTFEITEKQPSTYTSEYDESSEYRQRREVDAMVEAKPEVECSISGHETPSAATENRRSPQPGAVVICPSSTKGIEVFDGGSVAPMHLVQSSGSSPSGADRIVECVGSSDSSASRADRVVSAPAPQDSNDESGNTEIKRETPAPDENSAAPQKHVQTMIDLEPPGGLITHLSRSDSGPSLSGTARVSEAETRKARNGSPSRQVLSPTVMSAEQYPGDHLTSRDAPSPNHSDPEIKTVDPTANSIDGWDTIFCGSRSATGTKRISDSCVSDLEMRLEGLVDQEQLSPRTELNRLGKNASDNVSCGEDSAVVATFLETARVIGWGLRSWRGDSDNIQGDRKVSQVDNLLLQANSSSFSHDTIMKQNPPGEESSGSWEGAGNQTQRNAAVVDAPNKVAALDPVSASQRSLEHTDLSPAPGEPKQRSLIGVDVADANAESMSQPVSLPKKVEGKVSARSKSPRVRGFDEESEDDESSLLLALTRSEGEPPIMISSEASSDFGGKKNETSDLKSPRRSEKGGIPSAVIVKEGGPRKEFTRSPKLQKVLERLRSRKQNFGSDHSVSSADVDPVDVEELFSRYDNIVKHMVVFDSDRLQRAQGGQLSLIDETSVTGERSVSAMKESRHTKGERSSGSRPSHVIDVTDVRTTTARLYNTQRSASEPRLRELNQRRPRKHEICENS